MASFVFCLQPLEGVIPKYSGQGPDNADMILARKNTYLNLRDIQE